MDFQYRLVVQGEPAGQISLTRLIAFSRGFQIATFRSAQAELHIEAFRRKLGDEARPEYRLSGLTDGSSTLTVTSVDDRPLSGLAVTRHLVGTEQYRSTGRWPNELYQGELEAWGDFYAKILTGEHSLVEIKTPDGEYRIDKVIATALSEAQQPAEVRRITCVGRLHMIEVEKQPRFRINTEEIDLIFDLPDDSLLVVDPMRWQRVRAEAIWQVGTRRAELVGSLEPTDAPAGVTVEEEMPFPAWVNDQVERLTRLGGLRAGWDTPKSAAIRGVSTRTGQELSRRIYAQFRDQLEGKTTPYFFPNEAGNVEFEWQVGGRFMVCELVPGGYDVLVADGERNLYEGRVDHARLFAWIGWLLTGEGAPTA